MKGKNKNKVILVAGIVIIAFALSMVTGLVKFQAGDIKDCRIMRTTWGYYSCVTQLNTKNFGDSGITSVGWPYLQVYKYFECKAADITVNGIDVGNTRYDCRVSVDYDGDYSAGLGKWWYKDCIGISCTGYTEMASDKTIGVKVGHKLVLQFIGPAIGSFEYDLNGEYIPSWLYKQEYYGSSHLVSTTGCNLQAIISPSEWSKLNKDAKVIMIPGDRENFPVGWTDEVALGNYYEHSVYGPVVCESGTGNIFKISPYETKGGPGESGIFYDAGDNCYAVPEANPVIRNADCCPMETLANHYCDEDGNWQPEEEGEGIKCCFGGICSLNYCPGAGEDSCSIAKHKYTRYSCNEQTTFCEIEASGYAECCPPDYGCTGDEFCNDETYTCEEKPTGLRACDFQCCEEGVTNMDIYLPKECKNPDHVCCPGGVCKEECAPEGEFALFTMIKDFIKGFAQSMMKLLGFGSEALYTILLIVGAIFAVIVVIILLARRATGSMRPTIMVVPGMRR